MDTNNMSQSAFPSINIAYLSDESTGSCRNETSARLHRVVIELEGKKIFIKLIPH